MTITTDTMTTLASGVAVLSALRALAAGPPNSNTEALDVAGQQAALLHDALSGSASQTPAQLAALIPDICIDYIRDMPVPGTSFWAHGHWHIHIRTSDPIDFQSFTALHQLKHIIDYPVRQKSITFSEADWEAMADYFATQTLMMPYKLANSQRGRGNSYGSSR